MGRLYATTLGEGVSRFITIYALHYQKYGGTPPEPLLLGLRKALDMLMEEGLDAAARRPALSAEATRRAVERWAEGSVLAFNVTELAERANSVTTILVQGRLPRRSSTIAANAAGRPRRRHR